MLRGVGMAATVVWQCKPIEKKEKKLSKTGWFRWVS